jgi:mono/diheme cytochrome c family protein
MTFTRRLHGRTALLLVGLWPTLAAAHDFAREVQPIFERRCVSCHGPARQKGDLRLDGGAWLSKGGASGPVVVAGKSAESLLVDHLLEREGAARMPPEGEPLSKAEIALISGWIDAGAAVPNEPSAAPPVSSIPKADGWVWQPLRQPPPPTLPLPLRSWARNPIDAFVGARLVVAGLSPGPEADRRTLIRRLTVDLHGLLPTPEEVRSFETDAAPDAYERLVDRLLASPRYGERQARLWLDVAHYADSHGQEHDRERPHAWRYRDWLIRALNADLAYGRFVADQVAGDMLRPDDPEAIRATGFLAAGPWDESALVAIKADTLDRVAAEYLDRDDIVSSTMSAFAGVTVGCARCHDHKFDPVSQADYFALQAVFAGVEKGDRDYDLDRRVAVRRAELTSRLAALDASAADPSLRTPAALARLEQVERPWREREARWVTPEPLECVATGGTILKPLLDRSVLAMGARPERDRYTVKLPARGTIRAVRLEVLPDETLPQRGPGRQDNGNLHLSEFRLRTPDGRAVPIRRATADVEMDAVYGIATAIDGNSATGWSIFPGIGQPHVAIFELAAPLVLATGGELHVELEQHTGNFHGIGRFRLAVAEDPPVQVRPVIDPLADAFRRPPERRSAAQRDELVRAVLRRDVVAELASLPPTEKFYAARPRPEPKAIHLLKRGDPARPGEVAVPGALTAAGLPARFALSPSGPEGERRAALAEWLTHPANPLVWRTMANRAWHWRFGRGIVDTPNDLGKMGGAPSHPELLDWLAVELRSHGSLKRLHRLMVTSASYRQAFRADPAASAIDLDNRLLWRGERRRLDAETVRDSILAVSGRLDLTMFGPPAKHFVPKPGIGGTPGADYDGFAPDDPAGRRRSVYRYVFRNRPDPFLAALDCPDASLSAPVRVPTLGPIQALALWNNPFLLRHAELLAERVAAQATDRADQVRRLTGLTLQREPGAQELRSWSAHVERHGLASLCRVLLNGGEFQFVD